jgi:DNA polymerase III subunit gamma/tau
MSYIAIARKWRPSTFEEIAGQSHVTQTLQNAIERDRIHHAYLFSGPRGVGKTTCARALARSLNCNNGPTKSPCGTCVNCKDILKGTSTDVVEIDGASNNSVDNVRDLRESVQYMPALGRKRIYIIDEVHMLSKAAFNALLKTLEEPPEHVMFIFATTEPNKLPDTILSRVQRFEFKRIPIGIVVERLALICKSEGIEVDEGGLRLIARAGEGSMRDSQSLLDQVINFGGSQIETKQVAQALGLVDRALLYQMLKGVIEHKPEECLEAIEKVYSAGYDLSEFSSEMLEILRNATLVVLSPKSQRFVDIPEDEKNQLISMAKHSTADVFTRSFQVMLDVHEQVSRSPRPKLALEMAVARLISIRPARPIDELIEQINKMEGGGQPRRKSQRGTQKNLDADEEEPAPGTQPASISQKNTSSKEEQKPLKIQPTQSKTEPSKKVIPEPKIITPTPTIRASKEEIERFQQFRQMLLNTGTSEHHFTDEIAVDKVEDENVHFICVNQFQCTRIKKLTSDPIVLAAISNVYGGKRFTIRLRKDNEDKEIYKERVARLKQEKKLRLKTSLENEEVFTALNKHFKVQISKIMLSEDLSLE